MTLDEISSSLSSSSVSSLYTVFLLINVCTILVKILDYSSANWDLKF